MAKRGRSRTRTINRYIKKTRSRTRGKKGMMLKMYAKKAGFGVGLGLLFSIPLTLAGQAIGRSELVEAGQRIGSVASAAAGGTVGNAAYQIADAVFDRFVAVNGQQVSGGRGGFGI